MVYGAGGAFVALLLVQGLPVFFALARGEAELALTLTRVAGALGIIGVFLACGGVAAFLVGDATQPKHAVAYGLGWQGLLGGYIKNPRAATE